MIMVSILISDACEMIVAFGISEQSMALWEDSEE